MHFGIFPVNLAVFAFEIDQIKAEFVKFVKPEFKDA